jgi:hypothetical protein
MKAPITILVGLMLSLSTQLASSEPSKLPASDSKAPEIIILEESEKNKQQIRELRKKEGTDDPEFPNEHLLA